MLLYNRKLVDPYLLASRGLVFSSKQLEGGRRIAVARCAHQHCSLLLEFDSLDGEEEPKDEIEEAAADHDAECPFAQQPPLRVDAALFRALGPALYQQRIESIELHQKFIQLSPREVKLALGLQEPSSRQVNITLEMFRKLDRRLSGERLTKVRSAVFLGLFGWEFGESAENEMVCRFCATVRNVFEFLSPSECTLMGLPVGFEFISAHRPWCCLVRAGQPLWRETLKQVVLRGLEAAEGQVSRSESEMRCKELQDNAAKRYAAHYHHWTAQRRRLDDLRTTIEATYPDDGEKGSDLRRSFLQSIRGLEGTFEGCREAVESFIKRIKMA